MSDISEGSFRAGWMHGLEYDLWKVARSPKPVDYGMKCLDHERANVRELSGLCGGWIVYKENAGETFVPLARWLDMVSRRERR